MISKTQDNATFFKYSHLLNPALRGCVMKQKDSIPELGIKVIFQKAYCLNIHFKSMTLAIP